MLRREGTGHPTLRQERVRGRLPAGLQPLSREAVQQWAFCSLTQSGWAREFYDGQRARGKGHNAALRALGNRWLEVLWHCLNKGVHYDEAPHVANRDRALGREQVTAA